MKPRLRAYIQLMRPANIMTAIADILAGIAISGWLLDGTGPQTNSFASVLGLIISTIGLYGGGIVFNDVFDYKLDQVERPERPLPSRRASLKEAILLGMVLLGIGIGAAFTVSITSGLIAWLVAGLAVAYNAITKHNTWAGPLTMGLCRGGNLLLGVSIIPEAVGAYLWVAVVPILYIGAITLISQGEVHGGNRAAITIAMGLYTCVLGYLFMVIISTGTYFLHSIPFIIFLGMRIFPAIVQARRTLAAGDIRKAVKAGILSLIIMDAVWAAGFAGIIYGVVVLLLMPISRLLGKWFAVT